PVVAHNMLESIHILGTACQNFADRSIQGLTVRADKIAENVSRNPILVTALNGIIGYDLAAKIAKQAFAEDRPLIDVAEELTELSRSELETILNPADLTRPGIASS
ncbi:MAG: aspartate ammonia-lyase, partial [Bacteroidetes bacterium]|nr:aspartate ammonia-lyase [Bacteroidota bacterium]